ncbi:MAG: saccharopine dehydrogenase C-terminal domain-containing protein [Chitinophagales bacterium]
MRNIVMFGAGKSAYSLIKYILDTAEENNWKLTIADMFPKQVEEKFNKAKSLTTYEFNLENVVLKDNLIENSDIVISMLPARFHQEIASSALKFSKHLITPSYCSKEMTAFHSEVKAKGLVFLNEIGLDPGIDHMSAMELIHRIQKEGKKITAFESFTGGLIAPESDNNPWHYKFTWNPRNVILAGAGGSVKFLHNGKHKYIPYHKLFERTEAIHIENFGEFEGIANRDSLKYIDIYGLHDVKTMYRGTLRRPPYSKAWALLVQIGATVDSFIMEDTETMTYRQFTNSFLKYREGDSVELKLAYYVHCDVDSDAMKLLKWVGLFENKVIGLKKATPAQVLQHLFEQKWTMESDDKDMIVMHHLFKFGEGEVLKSSMVVLGDDNNNTAMAKTVGLPIAIAAKLILNNKIKERGVLMPMQEEIYKPILEELKDYGVIFNEKLS